VFQTFKKLLKHSFVYSISNVAVKASGIILLPLYTTYFSVAEYGRLGLILITIIIISQSLIFGQGLSLIRYNNSTEFKDKKKSIFFTLSIVITFVILIFIIVANSFITQTAALFGNAIQYKPLLQISIYIISVITLNNLLLSKLRADENTILYTLSSIVKIIVMVLINIYLIVYEKLGIESVLYAQLIGELIQTAVVLPPVIKHMEVKFEYGIIPHSLKFGVPLIFSAMAINLLNGSDRYLLKFMTNENVLGLYELGYKVAGVINMFVILPFGLTLMPLAYKMFRKEGDKEYYSKLKTYVTFVLLWAGLALSLFGKELIMLFAQDPSYYPAYSVVPFIVLAYVIYGTSMISSLGMILTGNNFFVAFITLFCASLNIGLNFWLIPEYGMMGAAINTVVAFFILDFLSNVASNRYYKIPYEYLKILTLFLICITFILAGTLSNEFDLITRVPIKLLIIIVFPLIAVLMKYFKYEDLVLIKGAIKKWIKPSSWMTFLKKKN
jgi:O-antigen/teichoic acid export membrane protein